MKDLYEYVTQHTGEIAEYVNKSFEESKDSIKDKIIEKIKKYLTPVPIHYEWKQDDNPYDFSGVITASGYISINQSIINWLENEYTGGTRATHLSHFGWHYDTYGDELSYYTLEIATDIMMKAIRDYIENYFSKLSDEEFEEVKENCDNFDDIYDNCIASDFFDSCTAIQFVDISNIQLNEII